MGVRYKSNLPARIIFITVHPRQRYRESANVGTLRNILRSGRGKCGRMLVRRRRHLDRDLLRENLVGSLRGRVGIVNLFEAWLRAVAVCGRSRGRLIDVLAFALCRTPLQRLLLRSRSRWLTTTGPLSSLRFGSGYFG